MTMPEENTDRIALKHDLRLETAVVVFKGLAHLIVGVFTPWAAALAQWTNSEQWPAKITWIGVILPASAVGGCSALLAFLSGSFQTYQRARKNGATPTKS